MINLITNEDLIVTQQKIDLLESRLSEQERTLAQLIAELTKAPEQAKPEQKKKAQ
jgi:uncharacterized coiled-coil protein SlyX